jgi:AbrB family looped-hinge helix DNA binding protein
MEGSVMTKVTAKYQITIPPEVRTDLDIVPGSEVDIRKEGDRYVLLVDPIKELKKRWRGKFKSKQTSDDYMNHIRGEVE